MRTRTASPLLDEGTRADLAEQARALVARYPAGRARSALLPMLHLVQSVDGYVSGEGIAFCAEQLGLTKAEVGAVATFYTMFKRRPTGEYLVSVCTNTMCGVLGGERAYEVLSEHLGVGHDQTTEDGRITLEHAECLAACDYAPVMTVNYEFFDQVDADSALGVVRRLQDGGELPVPTRGARLCSFKEISRQLAGFADPRAGAVAEGPAGAPTLAGNTLADERGVSVPGFDPTTPISAPREATPAPASAAQASAAREPASGAVAGKGAEPSTSYPASPSGSGEQAATDAPPATASDAPTPSGGSTAPDAGAASGGSDPDPSAASAGGPASGGSNTGGGSGGSNTGASGSGGSTPAGSPDGPSATAPSRNRPARKSRSSRSPSGQPVAADGPAATAPTPEEGMPAGTADPRPAPDGPTNPKEATP